MMTNSHSKALNRALMSQYIKALPKTHKDISFASYYNKKGVIWGVRIFFRGTEFQFEAGGNIEDDISLLELINLKISDLCQS